MGRPAESQASPTRVGIDSPPVSDHLHESEAARLFAYFSSVYRIDNLAVLGMVLLQSRKGLPSLRLAWT